MRLETHVLGWGSLPGGEKDAMPDGRLADLLAACLALGLRRLLLPGRLVLPA